jgi:hypothetical protein
MHCLKGNRHYEAKLANRFIIMISFYMSKRLPLIFLCIFLFSFLLVPFHHHADHVHYDDCPLCMFSVHNSAVIPQDDYQISATFFTVNSLHTGKDFFSPCIFKNVLSIRGPPS